MIAISVYILYLVDRLLSRVETLEKSVVSSQKMMRGKPEELEESLKKTATSLSEQIKVTNEILKSTGKDIDSINSKIASHLGDLEVLKEKIEIVEKKSEEIASVRRDVSVLARRLEQLEQTTDVIASRQQLIEEF